MTQEITTKQTAAVDRLIRTICARLAENKRVRRKLPVWGRLHIDRQLPFLCVYRRPVASADTGTDRLVTTEASYLYASASKEQKAALTKLVSGVVQTLGNEFGAFLLLELWSGDVGEAPDANALQFASPQFRVFAPKDEELDSFVVKFRESLSRIKISKLAAKVEVVRSSRCYPPTLSPVLPSAVARELRCISLGLEIRPVYRHPKTNDTYPVILRDMRRELTRGLRRTFYEFSRIHTSQQPKHFHTLGRRAVVKSVWEVDRQLAQVSNGFDFLLQVTPVNAGKAWHQFERRRFEKAPVFRYRPLPADPIVLKRMLYDVPLERIEDPTLLSLFRNKQDELDRKITMLVDINTRNFVHGSLQVYGGVEDDLQHLAAELLDQLPSRSRNSVKGGNLPPSSFAELAEKEIEYLRQQMPDCKAQVRIRDDIVSTMVSRGSLLIREKTKIAAGRVAALLQHEVGTHLLTYWNGRAQPLKLLSSGLAGYEATQEGLAVLAEYLVGGLNHRRVRTLAARVLACRLMIEGASFVETFRVLDRTYEFDQATAFSVTMRIYRGGGLTKDAIYLRGLIQILEYFKKGGDYDPLLLGKLALEHVPVLKELQWRKVLQPAPLRPKYLDAPESADRLKLVCAGMTVLQLCKGAKS